MVSTQVSRWPRESAASNARDMARGVVLGGGRSARSGRGSPDGVARPPATAAAGCAVAAAALLALAAVLRRAHESRCRLRGGREGRRTGSRANGDAVHPEWRPGRRRAPSGDASHRRRRRRSDGGPSPRSRARRVAWGTPSASRDEAATRRATRARRGRGRPARSARTTHVGRPPPRPHDPAAHRTGSRAGFPRGRSRRSRSRVSNLEDALPSPRARRPTETPPPRRRRSPSSSGKSVWMRLSEPPFYPFSWFRDVASKSSFSFQILSMSVGQEEKR